MAPANSASKPREVDLESLKALAHPLRVRILDTLSTYGEFTASGLAERLGESSGATSYHLRQLAKHDFVREVEGKGTARERWWERSPGGIAITNKELMETPSGRAATKLVVDEWRASREALLTQFLEQNTELPERWMGASAVLAANVHPTAEQLEEFTTAFATLVDAFIERTKDQRVPGSRPVQVQFNAFPIVDGIEIPERQES